MKAIRIPSFTTPGVSYVVGPRGVTLDLACECPAFRRDRPCKHVRVYRSVEHALVRCQNAEHLGKGANATEAVCPTCLATIFVTSARRTKSSTREALDGLKARLKIRRKKKKESA